jgi:branched-chain amino acid transport system permease protein
MDPLIYGILFGGLLALAGIGFSLVYGVLDIVNLAHGVFIAFGGYISYWLVKLLGVNIWLTLPINFFIMFIVGYYYQRLLIQRVVKEQILYVFALTFGASLLIQNLMTNLWTNNYRSIELAYRAKAFFLFDVRVPYLRLIAFLIAVGLTISVYFLLNFTKQGKAIRAIRDSSFTAELLGVDINKSYALTMALSCALAGVAGGLLLTLRPISPLIDLEWTMFSFIVVVFGGAGSVLGSLLGGIVLGVIIMATSWYISQGLALGLAFTVFIFMLIIKPTGFFGIEHEVQY